MFGTIGGILSILISLGRLSCAYISEKSWYIQQFKDLINYQVNEFNDTNISIKEEVKIEKEELNKDTNFSVIYFKGKDKRNNDTNPLAQLENNTNLNKLSTFELNKIKANDINLNKDKATLKTNKIAQKQNMKMQKGKIQNSVISFCGYMNSWYYNI